MRKLLNKFVDLYPVWITLSSLVAFFHPPILVWFTGPMVVIALASVMLGMGISLVLQDFKNILLMPFPVIFGIILQYTIMPLIGWSIGKMLNLDSHLAVGLIIVASCPGGTASNVIAFLAKGNVALSIVLTTVSTIVAIVATPLLCQLLAGEYIPVDAYGLFITTIKVILVPVSLGVFLNYKFPSQIKKVSFLGPVVSVIAIIFISGSIVAQSASSIAENAGILFIAVSLLHISGFGLGYYISKIMKFKKQDGITLSIEVGMQNGGLAAVLAKENFPLMPLVAIPAVFSSVIQTIVGGILAAIWSKGITADQERNKKHLIKRTKNVV